MLFTTNKGRPLVWRNLEVMVNEEDESFSLLMDRNMMETIGYSVEAILQGAREKQTVWEASVDETQEVQTPVSKSLQSFEKKLYADLHDTVDEAERCLSLRK